MQPRPEATTSLHILHLAHHREISTPTLTIHGSVYSCIGIGSNRRERNWPSTGCAKNVDIIKVSVGWALWGIYGGGGERGRIESVFQIHEGWSWPFIPLVRNPGGWWVGDWLARSSPLWLVKMTDVHRNGSLSRSTRRRGGGFTMVGPDSGIICFELSAFCISFLCAL